VAAISAKATAQVAELRHAPDDDQRTRIRVLHELVDC